MGWVTDLHGKTIGLDTAPLIYFIEQRQDYADVLRPFFEAVTGGYCHIVTSTVTLLEVLVHPLRHGDEALAQKYNDILLNAPNITTVPVTPVIAQEAAQLRADHSLKTPDAIQVATALGQLADAFLTNDRGIYDIEGLDILNLNDLLP